MRGRRVYSELLDKLPLKEGIPSTTANMNPSRRISAVWGWPTYFDAKISKSQVKVFPEQGQGGDLHPVSLWPALPFRRDPL